MLKNIDKFGFELEGGWEFRPKMFKGDGSVYSEQAETGEIASNPYKSLGHAKRFIDKNYPKEVNQSCGFHIHISTKKKEDYLLLTHPKFYKDFIFWAKKWNKEVFRDYELQERILGKNEYCKRIKSNFHGIYYRQIKYSDKRFRQLNFCYGKHKTLENRLFPMFKNSKLAFRALSNYINFVDSWIENNKFLRDSQETSKHILKLELDLC